MNEPEAEIPPPSSVEELLGRLPVLEPPTSTAGAAVTIVLREGGSGPEVLLIERTVNPDDPGSGQVALPGGRVSERDGNLARTATRELEEEVGLAPADLAGPLRFVRTAPASRFALHVGVFAAAIARTARAPRPYSPREVAHVFWMPRHQLGVSQSVAPPDDRGPGEVRASVFQGHVVWGFTRRVLRDFFGYAPDGVASGPAPRAAGRPSTTEGPGV